MTIYSTGEMSGRIAERDLRRLQIPLPDDHHRLGAALREHRQRIAELRSEIVAQKRKITQLCSDVIGE